MTAPTSAPRPAERSSSRELSGRATDLAAEPSPVRRNLFWSTVQCGLRVVLTIWLRYRARGIERVPAEGGGLVVANHQSFLDPFLVGLPLSRPVSYLARDSLFRLPVVGWVLRNAHVMPINREAATAGSMKSAVGRMRDGCLVGIFPEGTRSRDGRLGPFKPGFVALVRRGRLPVYPVGIAGAHEALPRDAWVVRPRQVCVVFGEPIRPEEIEALSGRGREDELVALVHARVLACQREAEEWRRRD